MKEAGIGSSLKGQGKCACLACKSAVTCSLHCQHTAVSQHVGISYSPLVQAIEDLRCGVIFLAEKYMSSSDIFGGDVSLARGLLCGQHAAAVEDVGARVRVVSHGPASRRACSEHQVIAQSATHRVYLRSCTLASVQTIKQSAPDGHPGLNQRRRSNRPSATGLKTETLPAQGHRPPGASGCGPIQVVPG